MLTPPYVTEAWSDGLFRNRGESQRLARRNVRIFLGIQWQFANCHEHPTYNWKRDQFHGWRPFSRETQSLPLLDSMFATFEIASL